VILVLAILVQETVDGVLVQGWICPKYLSRNS
jgi:hypothetical protein